MTLSELYLSAKVIVFTDMDGTLLNHQDYDFSDALNTLSRLRERDIKVIPNTSKTFAEMQVLCDKIGLEQAFIIENGAAIYLPQHWFSYCPSSCRVQGKYFVKEFARSRRHALDILKQIAPAFKSEFEAFSDISTARIASLTGLNPAHAALAAQRGYAEPIVWLSSDSRRDEFIERLREAGGHVVRGGRFIHLGDHCDKSSAMQWACELFSQYFKQAHISLALGDGMNDQQMLESADVSCVIKSPVNPPLIVNKQTHLYRSETSGALGWAHMIERILLQHLPSTD